MPVGDPAVVVESGPVVYDDAAAEDEEEEDEEACVSAMDLLGGNGQSQLPVSCLMILPRVTPLAAAATAAAL